MCPTFETRGTLAIAGVFKPGAVSTLERDADLSEVLEAFLASQIPNKATQRGYRRHLRHAFALMAVETLAEIQPVHLQSFRGYLLADGRGSATHAQCLIARSATRVIKEAADRAGIKKRITPHCLRHTFAFSSYLYCRNLMAVSKLLGHATISTTQRYVSHLDQLDLRNAIPAFLSGGKGPRVLPTVKKATKE